MHLTDLGLPLGQGPPFEDYSTSSRCFLLSFLASCLLVVTPFICWAKDLVSILSHNVCGWPMGKVFNHPVNGESQLLATDIAMSVLQGKWCPLFIEPKSLFFTSRREERCCLSALPHIQEGPNSSLPPRKKKTIKVEYLFKDKISILLFRP